jgi:predicted metal-binding membrane protein
VDVRANRGNTAGLAPAYAAVRTRLTLVGALFAVAGLGWVWTDHAMRGMDAGPWSSLGSLTWFLGVWLMMMAAMMLPSVAPTIALFARLAGPKSRLAPWLFVAGYLLAWGIAGLLAYGVGVLATMTLGEALRWDHAGRAIAAATLGLAAAYELTPLKDVCLGTCRSPLGALLGSWRDGLAGALRMGARNGAWCIGCCWALMASLFALGLMSLSWMALVAALIAIEKTLPGRHVTLGVAGALAVLAILLLTAPDVLPWLTIPGATMSR